MSVFYKGRFVSLNIKFLLSFLHHHNQSAVNTESNKRWNGETSNNRNKTIKAENKLNLWFIWDISIQMPNRVLFLLFLNSFLDFSLIFKSWKNLAFLVIISAYFDSYDSKLPNFQKVSRVFRDLKLALRKMDTCRYTYVSYNHEPRSVRMLSLS